MKTFKLDVLGNNANKELAFVNNPVEGIGLYRSRLARGGVAAKNFPEDATIQLLPRKPGRKLSSFIGNTQSMLIVDDTAKEIILQERPEEVEVFKFTLLDQKGKVLSEDHWILNPLGQFECVDREHSDIQYLDEPDDPYHGEVVEVHKFVLKADAVEAAPAVFHMPESPATYFFKQTVVDRLREAECTNFVFEEVESR